MAAIPPLARVSRYGDVRQTDAADRMSRALSRAVPPEAAAAWLEGFLGGGGMLLAHDAALFQLLGQWVVGLSADHFIQVLPLVRRTFSTFPPPERRRIGERVLRDAERPASTPTAAAAPAANRDLDRAERLIPTLSLILGIETEGANHESRASR